MSRRSWAGCMLLAAIALALLHSLGGLPEWLWRWPWVPPLATWINASFDFVAEDLGLMQVTRGFALMVQSLLDVSANLLYGKNRWPKIGPIPWVVIALWAFWVGWVLRGWMLGLLSGGTFVWIAMLGQWKWAMETLSVILIAAPFSIFIGLVLAVLAWKSRRVESLLNPLLNLAQSLPHFAYMIPVVVFIGVGAKAGAIVTIIFATPPMIRMGLLGLKRVSPEIIEAGTMCGASDWQLLTRVRIPSARNDLLIGVNQVIMQCLAMVVLASFIGMPGLGNKLLQLLQALKVGRSIEIGITIVLLAIVLDRITKAWAERQPQHYETGTHWSERYRAALILAVLSALGFAAGGLWDVAVEVKRNAAFSMSKPLDNSIGLLLEWMAPAAYEMRAFLIPHVLIPLRDAYLSVPSVSVILGISAIGYAIGGWRSALVCAGFVGFLAVSGWWDRSMITAYMVSFAVLIAALIGLPLGILAAQSESWSRRTLLACDTAQTFPSFIYLIPVVMLFGVNDVAAIAAVVVFAAVPLTRYTIEGLRGVPETLIEASDMCGASRWQQLLHVRLPMAVPTMMVGLNQTTMFSLFMVIIAAFIGTQDLGQEMQRALSSTDVGKGLVLGFCVASMGLMIDHLITRWSRDRQRILGLA